MASFGILSKKNIHNYLERLLKESSLFQLHIDLCKAWVSLYTLMKTAYNRLKAEADMRIQMTSIKPDIKNNSKNVN